MSDFFEPPPPPPPGPPEYRPPAWASPPDNEIGVALPLQVDLVRTDRIALAVVAPVAFSTGFSFMLALRHCGRLHERGRGFPPFHPFSGERDLRFGVQFADGAKATTSRPPQPGETPLPPQLTLRGAGGGGGRSWNAQMWLWPLPPPGPLAFVCEWQSEGIDLTRHELDAQVILDAAARVEPLWPEERLEATSLG